jgi:hypothetical protein
MRENVLSFMLGNSPAEQVKGGFILPGEVWRMHNEELVKEVLIYLEGDLYLDILSLYLDNKSNLLESNFSCFMGDGFSLIGKDDLFEMTGGHLAGIDLAGEYLVLGELVLN